MRFIGRLIKYLLRSIFSVIVFLLLVGWSKMNRDIHAYIDFLDSNDRSIFHRSQPATWADPFWSNTQDTTGAISDILSDESLDAEMSGLDSEMSGLDSYDPMLEEDLNTIADGSMSGEEDGFGFVTDDQTSSTTDTSASKSDLLNLIKQRELVK